MGALLTDRLLRDVASVLEVAGQPGTDEDTQHHHDGTDDRALRKRLSDRVTDDAGKYRLKGIDENGTCRRDEFLRPAHHNLIKDNHADQNGHTDISHGRRIKANVFKDNAVERAPKRDGNQLSKAKKLSDHKSWRSARELRFPSRRQPHWQSSATLRCSR